MPFLLNIILEVLAKGIRQVRKIKVFPIIKKETKQPPITDNMILYIETTKKLAKKKLLE